jgi:hypothetical protein
LFWATLVFINILLGMFNLSHFANLSPLPLLLLLLHLSLLPLLQDHHLHKHLLLHLNRELAVPPDFVLEPSIYLNNLFPFIGRLPVCNLHLIQLLLL